MKLKQLLRLFFLLVFLAKVGPLKAQKLVERNGLISFEASEALFEPVEAKNESVTAVMDSGKGEIASLALIKGFRFPNSLMEEHFNENYIESATYPKATFKGKLIDFNYKNLDAAKQELQLVGTLALHGKSKSLNIPVAIQKTDQGLRMWGTFSVSPADFDIEIPAIVRNKIAREVMVSFEFNFIGI